MSNITNTNFFEDYCIFCFSHLRWNFVYQRPQHLLSRFARNTRVYFFEEPVFHEGQNTLHITQAAPNITVVLPQLKMGMTPSETNVIMLTLVARFLLDNNIRNYCAWYYTPMALDFTFGLQPDIIVYDCMDELSAFKFAPATLKQREQELLGKADVVFTGGYSIYHAKKSKHFNIHPFPSSIDKEHFAQARLPTAEPWDQQSIPHPRFGFFGVIDERFNIELVKQVALQKPQWHFVIIGPVVKIDVETLPQLTNIHYLGGKDYSDLPQYLAGWDIAMIPFVINESTQFISPTKTPEYLAGGKPVISTAVTDVVESYGKNNLVHIAETAEEFITAAETELEVTNKTAWLKKVDEFLKNNSWDNTWQGMIEILQKTMETKKNKAA